MPKRKSAPPQAREQAKAELERATDILFKAWGDWYRSPPEASERAKLAVEDAERRYREARSKVESAEGEDDPATR